MNYAAENEDFTYGFRKGAHVKNLSPRVVSNALDEIYGLHGKLDASTVVNLARKEDHPLHNGFEWEDSVAGEEYRKHQARVMIGAVIKVRRTDPEPLRFKNPYINVWKGDERTYLSSADVFSDKELRQQVLKKALGEAKNWKERYVQLKELSKIFSAIDNTTV